MKVFITIAIIIFLSSCSFHNPDGHNYLKFEDAKRVYDSLDAMESLLNYIPERKNGLNTFYEINNGQVSINGIDLNNLDTTKYKTFWGLKERFVRNAIFLSAMEINSSYFDSSAMGWIFIYRRSDEQGFDDLRLIQIRRKNSNRFTIHVMDTILDEKNNMYLLAPKGARIR